MKMLIQCTMFLWVNVKSIHSLCDQSSTAAHSKPLRTGVAYSISSPVHRSHWRCFFYNPWHIFALRNQHNSLPILYHEKPCQCCQQRTLRHSSKICFWHSKLRSWRKVALINLQQAFLNLCCTCPLPDLANTCQSYLSRILWNKDHSQSI